MHTVFSVAGQHTTVVVPWLVYLLGLVLAGVGAVVVVGGLLVLLCKGAPVLGELLAAIIEAVAEAWD